MSQALQLLQVQGESRIDSRLVAQGIHVQHDNLIQTIRKYQAGLEKYGLILFETGKIRGRGRPEQYVLLNKEQFGYLLMFVRVTDQVREYREFVYDKFLEYERSHQIPNQVNTLWQQRLTYFHHHTHIPAGYWCVFGFAASHCWTEEFKGVQLLEDALPDGSVGKRWCSYLRAQGYDMSLIKKYPHHYPDKRGTVPANIYPNAWLSAFWSWFHEQYLKQYYPTYLRTHIAQPDRQLPREKKRRG